jgi:hypothetical protein
MRNYLLLLMHHFLEKHYKKVNLKIINFITTSISPPSSESSAQSPSTHSINHYAQLNLEFSVGGYQLYRLTAPTIVLLSHAAGAS